MRPPCSTLSDARRSMTLVSRGAGLARTAPFGLAAFAGGDDFRPALSAAFTPALPAAFTPGVTPPRPRSLAALPDAFRIFAAPADLSAGRARRVQDFPDLLHQIFGEARLGDEGIAPGLLRAFGDAGQRVAG